jgi:predicted nuclease of predicted toxin-antitoxin system
MNSGVHFLVDASLPRATAPLITAAGLRATDVRDIGLGTVDDRQIANHARHCGLCLMTRDGDFGNILDYPPQDYAGIVVIDAPEPASRNVVLQMVERFLQQLPHLVELRGRLAIVEVARIRLRPVP